MRCCPNVLQTLSYNGYNSGRLRGLGSATLKALRELQIGGHWALVGRTGEYAAGNGAAMRIAPLAFKENVNRQTIHDVCRYYIGMKKLMLVHWPFSMQFV